MDAGTDNVSLRFSLKMLYFPAEHGYEAQEESAVGCFEDYRTGFRHNAKRERDVMQCNRYMQNVYNGSTSLPRFQRKQTGTKKRISSYVSACSRNTRSVHVATSVDESKRKDGKMAA